ncbi:MAG: PKD domain-containing protein [Candidatus Pacebacteria bacterium]|nr:PKD domain-containing protein [Candidatus Paceibacterota bacterium]
MKTNIFLVTKILAGALLGVLVLPLSGLAMELPNALTHPAAGITEDTAILNGELANLGGDSNAQVWFEYGQTTGYGYQTDKATLNTVGTFYANLTNLNPCTSYHFRAMARNSQGTVNGVDSVFITQCLTADIVLKANNSEDNITIDYNQPVTLSWQTSHVDSCQAGGDWSGTKSISGSEYVGNLTSSKTYSITCTGQGNTVSDTISVYVGNQPTLSVSLEAFPPSGRSPLNNVDLRAVISGAATGDVRYQFDCQNDGSYERDVTITAEPYSPYIAANLCNYPNTGTYTAKVRTTRGGQTAENNTTITVGNVDIVNHQPTADAGSDKNIYENETVILNGSGSDPDGDPITYSWTCTGGSLNSYNIAQPTYTAPSISENTNYSCTLTVADNRGLSSSDSVSIYVQKRVTQPEVETQSVSNLQTNQATLNGYLRSLGGQTSGSVWFQWGYNTNYGYTTPSQAVYSTGSFSYALTGLSQNTAYYYRAVVQTSQGTAYGQNMIFTTQGSSQSYPWANAGYDKQVYEGDTLVLNGSGGDPSGSYVNYSWSCTGGSLNNYNVVQPTFTAPQVQNNTNYTCTLTVTNSYGLSNSDSMIVSVLDRGQNQGGYLTVNKTVQNLTKNDGIWRETIDVSPYDDLLFGINIQNTGQDTIRNIYLKENLPSHIIYQDQLRIDNVADSRVPTLSAIYIGDLAPGASRIITFRAKVDGPTYFNYGATTLINTVSVYNDQLSVSDPATVVVHRTAVAGAITYVNTGLADTLFNSLLLPLLVAGSLIFLFKSQVIGFDKWVERRKRITGEYRAQKKLAKIIRHSQVNS